MLIQKEKNPIFLLIIGASLVLFGLVYGIVQKDLAILLLFMLFGIFLNGISTYLLVKRYQHKKQLLKKYNQKEFLEARIAEVRKVTTGAAKLLKDDVYEVFLEFKDNDKSVIIDSEWLDKDYIIEKGIERNKIVNVCFLNEKNYIVIF